MRNTLPSPAAILTAVLLSGCATSPPPPPPPKPPSAANEMTKVLPRQGLNEVGMMTIRQAQRKSEEIDLVCLSAEQRAEFKQREQQAANSVVHDYMERMSLDMKRSTPQAHNERVAAQYALDRCEAALPANTDESSTCVEERAERARWGPEPSSPLEVPKYTFDSLTRMAKARAVIRAEYPACVEVK